MFHYQGEEAVAKAAEAAGIPYTLSTVATRSIEQVAAYSQGPKFFQIYAWHNRELVDEFIRRCQASNYDGIQLAVDLAALGNRERDLRNGYGRPLELRIKTGLSALTRPAWLYRFITSDSMKMANLVEHLPHGGDAARTLDTVNEQFDAGVTWERAQAMREQWQGPFVLKGIQCVEDARQAVTIGATGIILSNHGGRQLDGAPSALDLLPAVVDAVGGDIEVLIDGGVRRGADVIKAVALGAKACLIGRPYLYGLAAGGQAGVSRSLDILRNEMERVMKLIGCTSIRQLDSSYVARLDRAGSTSDTR
jgi:L-lactate dehydrogenase (cytochrome)